MVICTFEIDVLDVCKFRGRSWDVNGECALQNRNRCTRAIHLTDQIEEFVRDCHIFNIRAG
ncbi:MAG: hypothetical protein BWY72_02511 [Bacteroidetes bacterium ADurb.Bin416]|nr:MAG: hypothetical protein BWY72_02511 [Bacteroidetes bacterium ADurb.Bin416]